MMDFYYALTLYHILCCVLHKLVVNNNAAVLALSDKTVNVYQMKSNIENMGIFKKVFIINDSEIQDRVCMDFTDGFDEFEASIIESYGKISPIKMENYKDKYICADHFPSGMYCRVKSIGYYYFEDGNGQQSRIGETIAGIAKNNPAQYMLIEKYGLFGNNCCVLKRILDKSSQIEGYLDDMAIDFRAVEILKKMNFKERYKIFQMYNAEYLLEIECMNAVILISQSQANLGLMSEREQFREYALVLDYFAEDKKVLVKPHPNDIYVDYGKMGKNVQVLSGQFPIELLVGCKNVNFEKGISIWSTAINSVRSLMKREIRFSVRFDDEYMKIHRYFAASMMLRQVKRKYSRVYMLEANLELAQNMFMENGISFERIVELKDMEELDDLEDYAVLIVDETDKVSFEQRELLRQKIFRLNSSVITIMINSKEDCVLFGGTHYDELKNMAFWEIFITDRNNKTDEKIERIWFYMKDTDILERIKNFKLYKKLERTGLDVYINHYTEQPEGAGVYDIYDMKEIKGILEATEKRLLDELKNNAELLEIIVQQEERIEELEDRQKCGQSEQVARLERRLEDSLETINGLKMELSSLKEEFVV